MLTGINRYINISRYVPQPETRANRNKSIYQYIKVRPATFIDYWFRSVSGKLLLEEIKSSTTNVCAIYQGKLFEMLCVIPPIEEQHRIVAKVDELMAICNTMKARLNIAQTSQVQLADAIVEQAMV